METLFIRCTGIFRRLLIKKPIFQVEEIKQLFDDIIIYLNKLPSNKRKNDGMYMLTVISDELASANIIRLFDHLILRNHQIFLYIKQTFEMLFIKTLYSPTMSITKQEENCLDSISYLIVQLCLMQNEPMELFYGNVSKKILRVTKKPNVRDPTLGQSSRKSPELTDKPNLKTARLPPSAPPARPIEQRKLDITNILGIKRFIYNFVTMLDEMVSACPITRPQENNLPRRKYRDFFLSQSFFNTLIHAIEDISRNEYSLCHIKYKIVDRFVRLCSQLEIVDILLNPIVKCLQSKNYRHALESVEIDQIRLYPKQLFFLHECPQFIIQHNFLQQEQVVSSLCKGFIQITKTIFDKHFLTTDIDIGSNRDGDRRVAMHVISSHLEFLYHLSIIPSTKEYFVKSSVVLQLLLILKQNELIKSVEKNKYLFNADVGIIAYTLLLLCNLAYEKTILLKLKQTKLKEICTNLRLVRDDAIKFASKTLITILNENEVNKNHEPMKLREAYIKYLNSIVNEPKKDARTELSKYAKEIEIETKYKFLTDSFIERLLQDIKTMSTEEFAPNISKYKEAIRRIHICSKQESTIVEVLLNPVIECLKSEFYMKCYQKIDLTPDIEWRTDQNDRTLASKQIFYMRECPEFLCQHDYKRQKEVTTSLCQLMLQNAQTIFNQHLSVVLNDKVDLDGTAEIKNARIEALSFHIKLLSHFALTPIVRKDFLATPIIDQIFLILTNKTLMDVNQRVINKQIGIVRECLTLLYNLAFDNDVNDLLKTKNLLSICRKFSLENDEIIQFTSKTLIIMLDSKMVDELSDTHALCRTYINFMNKSSKEPRRPYQGVNLRGLIKNLEIIITNDAFQENIVNEKDGISSLIKCLFIKCLDNPSLNSFEKIRRFALNILWNILRSIYGLKACKQLKSNDQFVEHVLNISNQTPKKPKKIASSIIWKLGDERTFRLEHAEKERKRNEHDDDDDESYDIDNQLTTDNQQGIFDVFVSFSNNLADKIICGRISNRLNAQNIRVYIEKQGTHRLAVMKKAAQKQKTIVICLSNEFRKSKQCMTEIEYASKYKCPIIPILTDPAYKPKGWLSHLIGEKEVISFTQKNITDAVQKLINEINKLNELDQ